MQRQRGLLLDIGGVVIMPDADLLVRRLAAVGIEVRPERVGPAFARADAALARADDADSLRATGAWGIEWARAAGIDEAHAAQVEQVIALEDGPDGDEPMWRAVEPTAADALDALVASGVRIAAVSNAAGRTADDLRLAGLLDRFAVVIDSAIEGIEKPDPRIYRTALDALGVDAADAAFVSDVVPEVAGAAAVGISGLYVFDPHGVMPSLEGASVVRSMQELATEVVHGAPAA